jgi:outer membrane protein assembly factor BamB/predicted esterase
VKWNNLEFEHWGGDPLIRADDRIIVTSQLNKAARVVCIRDDGDKGVVEWFSEPITKELAFNETNVNIAPNGDIYVTSGVESPHALFAIKGNGKGLSTTSPWPKYMGNIQNNGNSTSKVGSSEEDKAYNDFYKRVQDDEPYIGFFAAEKKCITHLDDAYKKARRKFFLGVSVSDEEVEGHMEKFIKFCKENDYLNDGCEEQWQKTLTVLSYELYANMPIFEFSADNIIEHRNLIFAEYPNKKLALDLFLPKQPLDKPMPCVVCIHGGGWRVNRRLWFEPFAKYIASNGMAAVTIDYRMLPAVEIIDCIYDTKAAIRWVRANAKKYGIDPDRIGAIGASAGAHLIALLATTANVPELEGTGGNPGVSTAIQAAVGFATPAFKIGQSSSRRAKRFGLTEEDMKRISPYENISAGSAPLYLVHGTKDRTVNPQDSQDLYDRYTEVGAHAELKWVPDKGHDFYEGTDFGIALATEFFKKQFGLEQDIEDGTIKWSCEIRGIVLKGGLALGPDNTVYAGTTEGWVYGVNPNGSVKWELDLNPKEVTAEDKLPQLDEIPEGVNVSEIPDSIVIPDEALDHDDFSHSSGTLTADGKRLYVAGHTSGKIYCIDTEKGSVIWALNVREIPEVKNDRLHYGGGFVSSPAIGSDGTIYIGSGDWWGDQWAEARRMGIDFENVVKRRFSDRRLYAVNPDGTLKWTFIVEETDTHRTSIFGCPAIGADGTIYFGAFNGIFYGVKDAGDKAKELWRHEVKGEPLSTAPTHYQEFWGSAAIAKDGTIYVGNNDYHVYAFNPDGSIKWKFKTGNEVYQSVTIGGAGTIYIASEDRNIYALNPDGTLKWSWKPETGGIPFTASVTEDETIVFGVSGQNRIFALDGNTGNLKWQCILDDRRGTDGACTDPVIGPDGTIYMFGAGSINAIKGSSPLSTKSPWPKVNRDNSNTGRFY